MASPPARFMITQRVAWRDVHTAKGALRWRWGTVAAVALSVSLPVCLLTIGFFVLYRFGEDYFLVPRIIGRAVDVPALVTVVAVLVGAALLGVIGALVAIPISAALLLLAREVLFPRLDRG